MACHPRPVRGHPRPPYPTLCNAARNGVEDAIPFPNLTKSALAGDQALREDSSMAPGTGRSQLTVEQESWLAGKVLTPAEEITTLSILLPRHLRFHYGYPMRRQIAEQGRGIVKSVGFGFQPQPQGLNLKLKPQASSSKVQTFKTPTVKFCSATSIDVWRARLWRRRVCSAGSIPLEYRDHEHMHWASVKLKSQDTRKFLDSEFCPATTWSQLDATDDPLPFPVVAVSLLSSPPLYPVSTPHDLYIPFSFFIILARSEGKVALRPSWDFRVDARR
ncbi:uncharacterized protein ARMOST_12206 [Armillaria ostoyae]|uniref:Uncharacterized protein n=1 Tax=Armillaria ostoyae TaxID=47428 RepID=A0A284RJD1_ARMOS|nr:uncharacterized protein ARMOST_12206 [Armillaria ostoyae]